MAECKKQVVRPSTRKIINGFEVDRRQIGPIAFGQVVEEVVYRQTLEVTPEEDAYVLTLSQAEADVLVDILRNIGGCPTKTRRGFCDQIMHALEFSGVDGRGDEDFLKGAAAVSGSVYFTE